MHITQIKARIIRKMDIWRKRGGSHTENILKGMHAHLRGDKVTRKAIKEMKKDRWLIAEIKTGETHYALNPRKAKEILQFYEQYCDV